MSYDPEIHEEYLIHDRDVDFRGRLIDTIIPGIKMTSS